MSSDTVSSAGTRAQLVLAAAAVIAVALAPVVFAYLQLGYHADVDASGEYDGPVRNADRVLTHGVQTATTDIPEQYRWSGRSAAVSAVRTRLESAVDALRTSRVERGTVYDVAYNESVAEARRDENCPRDPNRQFGPCEADRGVVVQERDGETHVLAVAFDVSVTTQRGRYEVTLVV